MNKAELVAHVARDSDLSKDSAEKAVDAIFKNIEKALK
ncbi:MAG: HU family DNA-binding protein, partial [Methyloceanibacter sp.]